MEEYITLPKIDLHCHLDGSLSFDTIKKLMALENIKMDQDEIEKAIRVDESCGNLAEYLTKFELPLQLLKTPKSFEVATYELLKEVSLENTIYMEIRFAPFLSANNVDEANNIIQGAIKGLNKAKEEFDIESNLILCCMRHHNEEINIKLIDLAKKYLNKGVCGVDLAGNEAKYPMDLFENVFKKAKKHKIPFTIHAGECGDPRNIRKAIELGASRIGHGIAMMKDRSLFNDCIQNKIGIEMCPVSNQQTKAIDKMEDYPFYDFIRSDLFATINTDNRTVSNTNINKEIKLLKVYGEVDYIKCLQNAVEVSFTSDIIKSKLLKKIF